MGIRENNVETYFKDTVKQLGGITRKWVSPGHIGVPDQIAIINGIVWFVEIKPDGEDLAPWQEREQKRLVSFGANVVTLYGHDDVDQWAYKLSLQIVEYKD